MHVMCGQFGACVVHVHRASGERTCCCMASHESVVQASATCSAACRTSERACVCAYIRPRASYREFRHSSACACVVVRMQVSQPPNRRPVLLRGGCATRGRTSCSTCSTLSSGSEKDALLIRRFTKDDLPKDSCFVWCSSCVRRSSLPTRCFRRAASWPLLWPRLGGLTLRLFWRPLAHATVAIGSSGRLGSSERLRLMAFVSRFIQRRARDSAPVVQGDQECREESSAQFQNRFQLSN